MPRLDLSSLVRAIESLKRALDRSEADPEDEELRDAVIQRFEYTFELCWKMLKRRLEMDLPSREAVDRLSYRELVRAGVEYGLLDDPTAWFVYRDLRHLTAHTYDEAVASKVRSQTPRFARDAERLLEALRCRGEEG